MKISRLVGCVLILVLHSGVAGRAQTVSARETFRGTLAKNSPNRLSDAQAFGDYIVDGKLRLALRDAVLLTLANNTSVRINQLPVETAKNAIERAVQPFDPLVTSAFSAVRSKSRQSNRIIYGVPTLSSLNQTTEIGYGQTFRTGTNIQVGFGANKQSSNSPFDILNPSIGTQLHFNFTQPLLRNFGLFPNRAPIIIARRNLAQSRASFTVQVNDLILQTVNQYWNVVQQRDRLELQRKSLEQAEASYQKDKRALELGALSPLDIYRSESQVASRRVSVIQAEYSLKQAQDQFRFTVGANQDPYVRVLDLDFTEKPEPAGELISMDAATVLEQALARRPEFEALREAVANDDTNIRLAHNGLLPDLKLTGQYWSRGLAGNRAGVQSGLIDSLDQLFGFGFPTYGFGLTLNLPIQNHAAKANLGDALVSKNRNLLTNRQFLEQITQEVMNAVHNLENAKLSMAAAKTAVDLAQKNLVAEQRKYELGIQTIFFVLEAQTELAQAELGLLQVQIAYQDSLALVDHAMGSLPERYQVNIADLSY
jgi:outer membrane protein